MGLFDRLRGVDPLETRLERAYISAYAMMGFSPSEARENFLKGLASAKEKIAKGDSFVVPEGYGSSLLAMDASDPRVKAYLTLIRADGVLDRDILWFWNMHNLERLMMMDMTEMNILSALLSKVKAGLAWEEAGIETRKIHPYYGTPVDDERAQGSNRPIPYELKDRIDIYITNYIRLAPDRFRSRVEQSSSFNALVREEIMAANL